VVHFRVWQLDVGVPSQRGPGKKVSSLGILSQIPKGFPGPEGEEKFHPLEFSAEPSPTHAP